MSTAKEQILEAYEEAHAKTMRVLNAFPADKADLRPHPRCKSARELAFTFAMERGLGTRVFNDGLATGGTPGKPPEPPASWSDLLDAIEQAHKQFGEVVRSTPDEKMNETVKFFTGPQTMGDVRRVDFLRFLVDDEIHHRGQFSIYLRMAEGKVPSIYGPSADEPWM
jgi:uncharacterized damage-inducible protein DinB